MYILWILNANSFLDKYFIFSDLRKYINSQPGSCWRKLPFLNSNIHVKNKSHWPGLLPLFLPMPSDTPIQDLYVRSTLVLGHVWWLQPHTNHRSDDKSFTFTSTNPAAPRRDISSTSLHPVSQNIEPPHPPTDKKWIERMPDKGIHCYNRDYYGYILQLWQWLQLLLCPQM